MNIMILVAVGIIFYMFTRKKGTGSELAEPVVQKIHLATGTVKTAVIVKGSVKIGEPTFLIRPEKCPVGYKQSIFTGKCIPESVIQK